MSDWADLRFACMGSEVRLLVGPGPVPAPVAAARARVWLEDAAHRLSRFEPDSELSALNAAEGTRVPASPLLRAAVGAGLWAAEATDGLVDPTLVTELEAAGYRASRDGAIPAPLNAALAAAPPRRPARPDPARRWRSVRVLDDAVERPPGVRIDTGGTGKGLLADALVHRLEGQEWAAVDCGGDIRIAGTTLDVEVRHPLTGKVAHRLELADGGIATSGLDVNVWRRADGRFAHHLLDPSTGEPAWTGLVGATAAAPSALEAEVLAKLALLGGPETGRDVLAEHGGVLFAEDGTVELVGPLARVATGAAA